MSRLILAACCLVLFSLPVAAFAQSTTYPPQPSVAASGGEADGTAFTGDDLTTPIWVGAALLLVGGSAVYVARRRAQRFAG